MLGPAIGMPNCKPGNVLESLPDGPTRSNSKSRGKDGSVSGRCNTAPGLYPVQQYVPRAC